MKIQKQQLLAITLLSSLLLLQANLLSANAFLFWGKKDKTEQQETTTQPIKPNANAVQPVSDDELSSPLQAPQSPDITNAPLSTNEPLSDEVTPAEANTVPQPYAEPETKVKVMSPMSSETEKAGLIVEDPINTNDPNAKQKVYVTVDDPKNPLGITKSAEQLNKVSSLIEAKKYTEAKALIEPLMNWLVDATEAHINLNKTLSKIPSAKVQAELEKQLALQFAIMRDKAFFNRAMIALGENKPSEAVKNLSRVVQSQPRSAMGLKAYELLQNIGFTEKIELTGQ